MKIAAGLFVAFLLSAPLFAQHAGFHAGIARPSVGFPPTQAPAIAVRGGTFVGNSGFVSAPFLAVPAQPFVFPGQQFVVPGQQFVVPGQQFVVPGQQFVVPGQQFLVPGQHFVIPGQQVLISNQQVFVPGVANPVFIPNTQVLIPGQTFIPTQIYTPVPTVVVPAVQVPVARFGPPVRQQRMPEPAIGTPRAQVIQQLGHPSVSVITSKGEILQYSGGLTVVIQDGQVIRSR